MTATVRTVDHGYSALMSRMKKAAKNVELTVGIHSDAGSSSHGALSVIDIATVNEFGLGVPPRSFIQAWADERRDGHQENLRRMGTALVKGQIPSPKVGMAQLGLMYVGEIQGRMAGGVPPPNAPATVKRKGSSTPLIDTGVLRSSIASKVDGEGSAAIMAGGGGKPKGKKKSRAAKLAARLSKNLRRLKRRVARTSRRSAKRLAKHSRSARRVLVRRTKAVLRATRRAGRQLSRSARRTQRQIVRSGRRAQRQVIRSTRRVSRSVTKAARRFARGLR